MKLICIDHDNCAFYALLNELEDPEHNYRCPSCYGPAIIAPKNYNPLIETKPDSKEEEESLKKAHNILNAEHHITEEKLKLTKNRG
ncbi:MAG: hypothetical protein CMQ41_15795 [Gammaproteobacteria bacterium]|nr:hypothetical protein [Gammaproteobacteria bacterium]|tara:strand:+ start:157 stop:414 length:258 start_codon:yes stop_codon:yes gene_type:complete